MCHLKKTSAPLINNLKLHSDNYSNSIILGDLNANLLSTSSDATFIYKLASELGLRVVEHGPTHFATYLGTWIDAIFVNIINILSSTNESAPYHNQHNIIDIILDLHTPSRPRESFTCRPFIKISPEELNSRLSDCDWTPFDATTPDLLTLLHCLTENLTETVDLLAPEKTVIPKKRQPGWVDANIILLRKKRDAA